MRIAPEGMPPFLKSLGLSILVWVISAYFPVITIVPGIILTFFCICLIFFFRDPVRIPLEGKKLILAPADGMVLPFSEYIMENGAKLRLVSIFLSLFNVHVNRSPVSGIVEKIEYRPGKFIIASHKEASYVNEMNRVTVNCAQGKLVFQQVTGILARRVVCHLREGQYVKAGDRIGIMKLGSRMDLILPENIEIKVKPGDQVRAGLTVIGVWQSE